MDLLSFVAGLLAAGFGAVLQHLLDQRGREKDRAAIEEAELLELLQMIPTEEVLGDGRVSAQPIPLHRLVEVTSWPLSRVAMRMRSLVSDGRVVETPSGYFRQLESGVGQGR